MMVNEGPFLFLPGCGKSTGADLLGVDSEPWVFKGGVSGEVQVAQFFFSFTHLPACAPYFF